MSGPGLREVVTDIREAVERMPREALVDVLVHVFKEYVVQGPVPAPTPSATEADAGGGIAELRGLRFAELVRELQLRLDVPELELFEVQGERVMVRVGGRLVAVEATSSQPAPSPVAPPVPAPLAAPTVPVPAPPAAPQQSSIAPQQSGAPQQSPIASQQSPAASQQAPTAAAAAPTSAPAAPGPRRRLLEID